MMMMRKMMSEDDNEMFGFKIIIFGKERVVLLVDFYMIMIIVFLVLNELLKYINFLLLCPYKSTCLLVFEVNYWLQLI